MVHKHEKSTFPPFICVLWVVEYVKEWRRNLLRLFGPSILCSVDALVILCVETRRMTRLLRGNVAIFGAAVLLSYQIVR